MLRTVQKEIADNSASTPAVMHATVIRLAGSGRVSVVVVVVVAAATTGDILAGAAGVTSIFEAGLGAPGGSPAAFVPAPARAVDADADNRAFQEASLWRPS
jgi:hypothetical protein